ncbi:MAG: hypothetical protein LUG84_04330 [Akkermansiaceae bacterium]|nr:hypothetical protein [Akkermansiaceae bacterium]
MKTILSMIAFAAAAAIGASAQDSRPQFPSNDRGPAAHQQGQRGPQGGQQCGPQRGGKCGPQGGQQCGPQRGGKCGAQRGPQGGPQGDRQAPDRH